MGENLDGSRTQSPPRVIGVAGVACASVNWIVGAGIFGLPALAAASLGPAAVVGYIISAVVLILVGLCLAEAGSRVIEAGGPYAYATVSFGPVVGGVVGTLMWASSLTASAAVANIMVETLARAWPALAAGGPRAAILLGAYAVLAAVNVRGTGFGSRLSVVLAVAKLVPLIGIVLLGVFALHAQNLHWSRMPSPSEFGSTTVLLFFAFVGIEGGLYASAEVRDPRRTIPRAILLTALVVAALYMGLQLVTQGILGALLPQAASPLVDVAQILLGSWGARAMVAAVVVSTSGYLVADALCSPRAIYALAERGQLPRPLAALHPRFGTPAVAVCAYQLLCALLAISGSFRPLAVFTSAATLVTYAACCLGLLRLRARRVEQAGTSFHAPGGTFVPLASAALIGWLLSNLTREEIWATVIPMAVSAVAYGLLARVRGRVSVAGSR